MCKCCPNCGELINNGGMELFFNHIPTGWTTDTPDEIFKMDHFRYVHSGNYSVGINDSATLSQIVTNVVPNHCYEFSLFAVPYREYSGMEATVTFITPWGETVGGTIYVKPPFIYPFFSYYRILTTPAPCYTTAIRIDISAIPFEGFSISESNQSANIETINKENSENLPIPQILQFTDTDSLQESNSIDDPGIIVDDVSLALQ